MIFTILNLAAKIILLFGKRKDSIAITIFFNIVMAAI